MTTQETLLSFQAEHKIRSYFESKPEVRRQILTISRWIDTGLLKSDALRGSIES